MSKTSDALVFPAWAAAIHYALSAPDDTEDRGSTSPDHAPLLPEENTGRLARLAAPQGKSC